MTKRLILGCASTGAKFTPLNHRETGDSLIDRICTGEAIKSSVDAIAAEAEALYGLGVRYYHYHARNPLTREQTTDNEIYQAVSAAIQRRCPEMLLSFGASRNGVEVRARVGEFGEWERVSQCALPLHLGGAHFVTIQAAVELQVLCEIERLYGEVPPDRASAPEFLEIIHRHTPSDNEQDASLHTHSTAKGADYGRTSPLVQHLVYGKAVSERRRLRLLHEIEWVQRDRSYAMARYAVEHPQIRLGSSGQLSVTLLFGFSPRLPFPETYAEFKHVVDLAKSLEWDLAEPGVPRRKVTISVGAAVLPHQAGEHWRQRDVGPDDRTACAVRRLTSYAAHPDSGVDILRIGMEDTPYAVDRHGTVQFCDNLDLAAIALDELRRQGAGVETRADIVNARMGLHGLRDLAARDQREPRDRFGRSAAVQAAVR